MPKTHSSIVANLPVVDTGDSGDVPSMKSSRSQAHAGTLQKIINTHINNIKIDIYETTCNVK